MTNVSCPEPSDSLGGVQIRYEGKEKVSASGQAFSSGEGVQIRCPLGADKESSKPLAPKKIKSQRRLKLTSDSHRHSKSGKYIPNEDRINSWMIRTALDYINRRFHEMDSLPSLEDVESHLFTILSERLPITSDYDAHMGGQSSREMTDSRAERYAYRAAEYACQQWDPAYFENAAKRGRNGGKRSKRTHTWTLDDFEKVKGLTHAEAAAMLGKSVSHIRRMRAFYAPMDRQGEDFSHLLPAS